MRAPQIFLALGAIIGVVIGLKIRTFRRDDEYASYGRAVQFAENTAFETMHPKSNLIFWHKPSASHS